MGQLGRKEGYVRLVLVRRELWTIDPSLGTHIEKEAVVKLTWPCASISGSFPSRRLLLPTVLKVVESFISLYVAPHPRAANTGQSLA